MGKIILGLIIGIVIAIPTSVLATSYKAGGDARTIKGAECSFITGDDGQTYPSTCAIKIDKFNDGGNTCYVAVGGSHDDVPAISCVRYAR